MHKSTLTLLASLALAACSQSPAPPPTDAAGAASAPAPVVAAAPSPALSTALPRYHWQLSDANDATGQRLTALFASADKPLQLDFTDQALRLSNTCNRMQAGYQRAGAQLTLSPMASTLMACANPALSLLEQTAGRLLSGTLTAALAAHGSTPELTLTTASGDRLRFRGVATAETRFGGPGETVFFEIAADEVPCNHPLQPGAQCLNAREIHYDANGIKTNNPGPWQPLTTPIEGYRHEAGVRNVLRVKRYHRANPPADASSTAYVLDLVVETELPKSS